ncbi:MAG: ABC transporter substrate-binding protein [Candidatus Hermodarchaeota archaeon]
MRKLAIFLLVVLISGGILLGTISQQPVRPQTFLKYSIDLWYTPIHYGSTEQAVAELLKAQLEATGYFDVTIQSADWATYVSQLGQMPFYLLGWWFDYPDPSNYIDPFVGAGAFSLGTNYSSPTMDGYITTMLTDPNATARAEAHKDAQRLMAVDCPVLPLFTMLKQFTAFEPDVTGVRLEPSENLHYNSCKDADDQIVIGTTDSIYNIDPADCYDYFGSNTLVQLTHGLMEMNLTSTDASPGPIIEYYNVSADATEYNFTLKSGIQFSDGTAFNATAMKWNIDRAIALNGYPAFLLRDVVSETEVISPTLLRIKLSTPDATFLQRITYTVAWPISPASLANDTIQGTPGTAIPRGLGPYNVTAWTTGVEMILETWVGYFGPAPANNKVIIKFYADASTMLDALEAGTIDIAHRAFGLDEITDIMGNPSLNYAMKDTIGIRYFLLNVEAITDVRVRNAIAAAVHRHQITYSIFQSLNEPLFSMVPTAFSSHIDAFENGPNQAHVEGNMTAAGYGYQPETVTTTVTTTLPGTTITTTLPGTNFTTTLPGTTITLPGTTITLPGTTITLPGTTITLPGTTITLPGTCPVQTPGFEFLSMLAMLIALSIVLIFKKKKTLVHES